MHNTRPALDDLGSAASGGPAGVEVSLLQRFFASGAALNVVVYLVLTGLLVLAIRAATHGTFVYTLDDPYIHLALAERIRHGLYGLNAGEAASPSSSILWPLLFVPFAATRFVVYLPLVVNIAFGAATACLLSMCLVRIYKTDDGKAAPRARLLGLLLVLAFNLPGLTLTGMEHVPQVFLSVCCAYALICMMDGESPPGWTLAAAVLLPSFRYEGLLITSAITACLWFAGKHRKAVSIIAGSLIVPVAFSLCLRHLGLPIFPLSVLLKSGANIQAGNSAAERLIATALRTSIDTLRDPERSPELILAVALGYIAFRNRRRSPLFWITISACIVAAVQMLVGPNGWFYRYEIYALAYIVLIAMAADFRTSSSPLPELRGSLHPKHYPSENQPHGAVLIAVTALAIVYMQPLLATPAAALGIYEQQYQLARLTQDFYTGPIAVNDLGLVSFRRDPNHYVLDLHGLGSYESAVVKRSDKTPAWLDAITREHHIGLVAIYPEWFPKGVPASWAAVGKLCSPHAPVSSYSNRVMLYALGPLDQSRLQTDLERFKQDLPSGTTLEMNPANSYNTCPKD